MKEDTFTTEADSRNDRILNAFTGAYDEDWHIFVQEGPQNVADARGTHIANGVIPESREITTSITVDTENNRVTIEDNVGGMVPEMIDNVVTTIAETDDVKELEESGGSFGLGIWMMATKTDEDAGQLYVETRHESEDSAVATVLYPTGEHYVDGHGKPYGAPKTVRERANVTVDGNSPADREQGGTLFVAENVDEEVINYLSDWEQVEERLRYKFPTLTGPEKMNLTWEIDGETHEYDAPQMDDLMGEVIERHEGLDITKGDDGAVIDELVFFKTKQATPWENIPLMKTQPHTGRPYLVVDDYKALRAGVITSSDGGIAAYARVDTVCDQYEWEDPAHEGVQFDPSDQTDIGDKAKEIQERQVRKDIRKNSINEPEATEVADAALGEARKVMGDVSDGDLSLFGLETADGELTLTAADEDGLAVDVAVSVEPNAKIPPTEFIATVEAEHKSTGTVTGTETVTVTVAPGEQVVETVSLSDDGDGAYFVSGTLREKGVEGESDTSGTLVGVERDIQPTASGGGGGGGGGGRTQTATNTENSVAGSGFRITATEMHADEEDIFTFVEEEDGGYVLHIDLLDQRWIQAAMSSEAVRDRKQKEIVAREAVEAAIDKIQTGAGDDSDAAYYMFRRLNSQIGDIAENVTIE